MPRGRRAVLLDEVDQLRDVVRGEDRRQVGQKRAAAAAALDAWARAYGFDDRAARVRGLLAEVRANLAGPPDVSATGHRRPERDRTRIVADESIATNGQGC